MDPRGDEAEPGAGARRGSLARRTLIGGAAATGAAAVLRVRRDARVVGAQPLDDEPTPPQPRSDVLDLNRPAVVDRAAARGASVRVTDPPIQPNRWRPGDFITHVDVPGRMMALTFDDGPSPANTPRVLDALARYGIKATFYLIGVNVRAYPALARRIVDEGHELGNHSVYHTPYRAAALASQIGPNQDIIREATGVVPVTHRAPGLTRGDAILWACREHGLYETHTHMSTTDYFDPRRSASYLVAEFIRNHRNGALPIYHDGGPRRPTPDAVPGMIEAGLARGYTFVTATELVNAGTPVPGTMGYRNAAPSIEPLSQAGVDLAGEPAASSDAASGYIDCCGYDARSELERTLEERNALSRADRRRIVEVLAEIDRLRAED